MTTDKRSSDARCNCDDVRDDIATECLLHPFPAPQKNEERAKRNREIYAARKAGETVADLGARFGLQREKISQICTQEQAKEQRRCEEYGCRAGIHEPPCPRANEIELGLVDGHRTNDAKPTREEALAWAKEGTEDIPEDGVLAGSPLPAVDTEDHDNGNMYVRAGYIAGLASRVDGQLTGDDREMLRRAGRSLTYAATALEERAPRPDKDIPTSRLLTAAKAVWEDAKHFPSQDDASADLHLIQTRLMRDLDWAIRAAEADAAPRTAKASPDGIKLATAEQVAKQYVKNIRDGVYADDEAAATALEGLLLASYPRVGS